MNTSTPGRVLFSCVSFAALTLVLSGCEVLSALGPGFQPDLGPTETVEIKEIPSGDVLGGPIIKRTESVVGLGSYVTYQYPNGYVSEGAKLDPEWRKKKPKAAPVTQKADAKKRDPLLLGVDSFGFSGQPISSGATSGTVITKQF